MLTCLLVACHRAVRETPTPAKNVSPGLLAFFNDTGHVVTFPEARTFSLQIPGQRDSLRTALRAEHTLWRANSVSDYRFLLRTGCFCPGARGWLLIEVRTGQPLRAWDRAGTSAPLSDWDTFSIDGLFDMLDTNRDNRLSVRELRQAPKLLEKLDRDRKGAIVADDVPRTVEGI